MGHNSRWVPGFLALGIVWGSSFLFIELALESFTPAGIVFWRGLLGAVSLGVFLVVRRERLPGWGSHWLHISVVALLLNALPGLLFAVGQQWVSSSLAGVINATTPLMTVVVIVTFFRDQSPTGNQILGILLGILGILFVMEVFSTGGETSVVGVAVLLGATLCYGVAMPYAKKYVVNLPYSPYSLATAQVGVSAVLTFIPALVVGSTYAPPSFHSLGGIVGLGIFGTGLAYVWNYRNIELAGSVIASSVTYITPVVAVILGALLLQERLSSSHIIGGLLVIVSALLVQQRWRPLRSRR
jgi:drug/metabolite transporter (DMT)-like permease